ncbi:4'-phosphopantetheinyl transferase family protein [Streptomyces cyaneofuscatus]|uniref:4'-phosphopantetheinyl transferase family protein n=1 Tax=Streptomyces cyaneofuscatus TaxID=66883 RepID=UPI00368C2D9D
MIEEILPPAVASADQLGDLSALPPAPLLPTEAEAIATAVPRRRHEFAAVRRCARQALADLGLPRTYPILPGHRGAPRWPDGVTGSMTHCKGYRAAAVALNHCYRSIGIDAEPHGPLAEGTLAAIALPDEQEHVHDLTRNAPHNHWDRLLFSTKEAVFKAWFPLARQMLQFRDANVRFDPGAGTFTALLDIRTPHDEPRELSGRWLVRDGLLVTSVAVPHTASRRNTDGAQVPVRSAD